MSHTVTYVIWGIITLASAYFIMNRAQRDYRELNQLRPLTSFLELIMFANHGILVGLAYGLSLYLPPITQNSILLAVGSLIGLSGVSILFAAWGIFGTPLRMFGLLVEDLKHAGVYRYSRNPQIIGYGLVLLAFPFLWPNPIVWISLFLYLPMVHNMVRVEEDHLANHYGPDYEVYCQQVPRYFGFKPKEG